MSSGNIEYIHALWKQFQVQWQTARREWRDEMAAHFEKEFMQPWFQELPALLQAAEKLSRILTAGQKLTDI